MADPQNIPPEVIDAFQRGKLIEAIKLLRQSQNLGLAEAKGVIDALQRQQGNVKVAVRPTGMRPVKRHDPATDLHPPSGLSPGEVPRSHPGAVIAVVLLVVVAAVGALIWL